MDESYAEVGAEVILTDPDGYQRGTFIGKKSKVVGAPITRQGTVMCVVCYSHSMFYWPVHKMILASDVTLLTPEQKRQMGIR